MKTRVLVKVSTFLFFSTLCGASRDFNIHAESTVNCFEENFRDVFSTLSFLHVRDVKIFNGILEEIGHTFNKKSLYNDFREKD